MQRPGSAISTILDTPQSPLDRREPTPQIGGHGSIDALFRCLSPAYRPTRGRCRRKAHLTARPLARSPYSRTPLQETLADHRDHLNLSVLRFAGGSQTPPRAPTPVRLQTRLGPWRTGEASPGAHVTGDDELQEYIKLATGSYFHLVGTCAIGTSEQAVVDPDLRVRGIGNLRVADASVMPSIVAANINATVLAIAERAASIMTPRARR
jgi:GMC oxidoreductase